MEGRSLVVRPAFDPRDVRCWPDLDEEGAMDVGPWLEAYRRAWEEKDADAAAGLFAETATYRASIFESVLGRDEVRSTATVTATQEDVAYRWPPVRRRQPGHRRVRTIATTGADITLPGCLLLDFDEAGLCLALRELARRVGSDRATATWVPDRRSPPRRARRP
jgi:hypothetical protein